MVLGDPRGETVNDGRTRPVILSFR